MLRLEDILKATGAKVLQKGAEVFSGISIDSRTIAGGELFAALRGERFDGHDFLPAALDAGSGAIVERPLEKIVSGNKLSPRQKGKSILLVEDTLKALQGISHYIRMSRDIPVVGVTGSNGKTTTKELAARVLGRKFNVLKSSGNFNNQIGLPLNLCRLEAAHGAAVLEMGASRPADIRELCGIAMPTHGIITNVGESHLEGFTQAGRDPMEVLIDTKLDLARAAGAVVYNADDARLSGAILREFGGGREKEKTLVSFGLGEGADVRARGIAMERNAAIFALSGGGRCVQVKLAASGLFNVYNALAAAAAGLLFDISLQEAADAITGFAGVPMRYEIMERAGALILSDVYNANPASMEEALKELVRLRGGRAVAVLGDMLELGKYAGEAHRGLGARLASLPVDVFIAVGPLMALACEEFSAAKRKDGGGRPAISCADSASAAEALKKNLRAGDTVLVKGSRGIRMERALEGILSDDAK
ncbi:MAG: UDP-N-acetylmuramoyl-tripeptide--D-alanyl-D-alanine ligase [Nitrospiraceae bacterium]|nr:UDP-N-acetylmuramoyl-tripeptide--D-alanyl-D-alanine ligase [Nitrospiraceae bacterium]